MRERCERVDRRRGGDRLGQQDQGPERERQHRGNGDHQHHRERRQRLDAARDPDEDVDRRAQADHNGEAAMLTLVRALEAFAQRQLFKQYTIKTWDVRPEQLPQALQETCRTCFLDDVDGKYKLSLQSQFRTLAGLGDQMGQAFLRDWQKMKPLLDAANHAVLGHGFEPVKMERFHQLYEIVASLTGVADSSLPKFPVLNL